MKKNYIKKSASILFALTVLVLGSSFCFAAKAPQTYNFTADFSSGFKEPTVEHVQISSVIASGILNAKVLANFGDCSSANAYLEYSFDKTNISTISVSDINHNKDFYIGTKKGDISSDKTTIHYRIKVEFKSWKGDFVKYAPEGASEETFIPVSVVKEITKTVNGNSGDSIEIESGDQSKGDSSKIKVTVPAGAYSGSHDVVIKFIDSLKNIIFFNFICINYRN